MIKDMSGSQVIKTLNNCIVHVCVFLPLISSASAIFLLAEKFGGGEEGGNNPC